MSSTTLLLSTSSAGEIGTLVCGIDCSAYNEVDLVGLNQEVGHPVGRPPVSQPLPGRQSVSHHVQHVSQREYAFGNKVDSLDMPGRGVEDLREPRLASTFFPNSRPTIRLVVPPHTAFLPGRPMNSLTTRASSDFLTGGPTSTVRDLGALILTAQTVASSPGLPA